MWWIVAAMTTALAAWECESVGMGDVLSVVPPAVIVLGERHGTQPDLRRATRIVKNLSRHAPTTLALEAVRHEQQPVLDRYAKGEVEAVDLPEALHWDEGGGFPYEPYRGLVSAADYGVRVVGVGREDNAAPNDVDFPVPAGYMPILRDAMAGHEMPLAMQSRFVRTMAWLDYQMAESAVEAWDGRGYLVIVVGRGHVEGGKGVAWQAGLAVEEAVHGFVLAWGGDPPCYRGDRLWKQSLWEKLFQ
ncbi:MAG: ChaN family lipoprotein [Deltaproteobacteria bacterium]|nr:ChaN family lipoprotein [Deltaproteobacteria bacterium]